MDNIPNAEKQADVKSRLEKFAVEDVQRLQGTGLIVGHPISGMNCLTNLLIYGNIIGDGNFQHFPNLAGIRLERESFGRYRITGRYGPTNGSGNTSGAIVAPSLIKNSP